MPDSRNATVKRRSAARTPERPLPHKLGFIEQELERVAADYLELHDERFVRALFAEALLMILRRLK